jgi:proteasome lid subunit RPN8/RPN11
VIHEDGTASQPYSSNDYSANVLTVLLSDRAILHSHPDGAPSQPSDRDIQTAKVVRMPNYEVSGYAVWVATPDGKTHKVAFIEQGKHGTITIKYTGAK